MLSFERGNQVTNSPKQGVSLMPPPMGSRVEDVGWNWTERFPVSGRTPLPWTGGPSGVANAGESPQVQMRLS